jgi:hypothetical protein
MLAQSAALRTAVASIVTSQTDLSISGALKIDAFIRFYLNSVLANKHHAIYAPAVARAHIVRKHRDHLIEQLIKRVDKTVIKLSGNKIQCSSVVEALISRSKGDPAAVIKEALALRNKAEPLREWLGNLLAQNNLDTVDGTFEIHKELLALQADLERALGLHGQFSIVDAIEVSSVPLTNDIPGLVRTATRYIRSLSSKKRLAVLTEISKQAFYSGFDELAFAKLRSRCLKPEHKK